MRVDSPATTSSAVARPRPPARHQPSATPAGRREPTQLSLHAREPSTPTARAPGGTIHGSQSTPRVPPGLPSPPVETPVHRVRLTERRGLPPVNGSQRRLLWRQRGTGRAVQARPPGYSEREGQPAVHPRGTTAHHRVGLDLVRHRSYTCRRASTAPQKGRTPEVGRTRPGKRPHSSTKTGHRASACAVNGLTCRCAG